MQGVERGAVQMKRGSACGILEFMTNLKSFALIGWSERANELRDVS